MRNKLGFIVISSALFASLVVAGTALAATPGAGHMGHAPGVFGTVSAINGATLTVNSKGYGQNATPTTYSVDATNATVTKSGAASSLSSVGVGDMVMVAGTVSGTNVTATTIRDGVMAGRGMGMGMKAGAHASSTMQGNGQPVVGGSVTAVNGSSLTVTNKSNVTYTVDVSNAKVQKAGVTSTTANIVVGDNVVIQGTVNGNAIVASSVIDSGATRTAATSGGAKGSMGGFMGAIGGFFKHIFGFF
jgi:hypothetical protein